MMTIEPIETRYKGYRFRSRLEARWAVFFDAMGMSWRYEVEGFWTSLGPYLPDFEVIGTRRGDIHVEIKAKDPSDDEIEKLRDVAVATGKGGVMIVGDPGSEWTFEITPEGDMTLWTDLEMMEIFPPTRDFRFGFAASQARGARFEHGEKPDPGAMQYRAKIVKEEDHPLWINSENYGEVTHAILLEHLGREPEIEWILERLKDGQATYYPSRCSLYID